MRLRWLVLCDKVGHKTEPALQIWDSDFERWIFIETEELKEHKVDYAGNYIQKIH